MKKPAKISAYKLNNLFKRVYLNGIISNCKVVINKSGDWLVEAVDEGTTVLLSCKINLPFIKEKKEIGIGNVSMLTRFLSIIGDDHINVKIMSSKNRLNINSKNKGRLNYLMKEIDFITTLIDADNDENPLQDILDQTKFEIELKKESRDSLLDMIKLLQTDSAILRLKKNGKVQFAGGDETKHSFSFPIGMVKNKKGKVFDITIEGNALQNVLNVLDFEVNIPKILFAEDLPVVITENEDNTWALNIFSGEESENDDD